MIKDTHLVNLLRQLQDYLQDNKPVVAYHVLQDLRAYLATKTIEDAPK